MHGIALKVGSTMVFAIMMVLLKNIGLRVPAGEMVFFRSLFAVVPVVVFLAWRGDILSAIRTDRPGGHLARSFLGVMAMFLWFGGLQRLPLADGLAITYAAPLITVTLAGIILGERVRLYRWTAVALGFGGVLLMLAPHLRDVGHFFEDTAALGAMLAFLSAFFMAVSSIQVRRLTMTERTGAIVIYFSIGCAAFALLTAPFGWVAPEPLDLAALIAAGLLGGIGQLMLTQSYAHADISTIAPLEYTSMLWAVLLGIWLFGEIPDVTVLIGSLVVITAGTVIILRERRLGLDGVAAKQATAPSPR
jgi:drug/metabolite transporter (DMT)-like permease